VEEAAAIQARGGESMDKPETANRYGTALVISGPSGAGKTSVCKRLLELEPALHFSISCTTRPPRAGEIDGRDYYFLSREEFDAKVAREEFLEYAEVHGNMYGTLRTEVQRYVYNGQPVLLDIDVQGARQIRSHIIDSVLGYCTEYVFVGPPSFAEMERRLRGRGTDAEEVIRQRLRNARTELDAWREYDFLVINDTIEAAAARIRAILRAAECAARRVMKTPWGELESQA
jgi:guanylate kinase